MDFEQWKGFEKGEWKRQIDVRDFIQKNYTPYEGNSDFLAQATEKTKKLWEEVLELYKKVTGIRDRNIPDALCLCHQNILLCFFKC